MGHYSINKGLHLLMDGGQPYSFDGVLWRPPGISAAGASRLTEKLRLIFGHSSIQNRSGGSVVCGVGGRVHPHDWKAGLWTHSSTTYTDDTEDAQDSGTNDFALGSLTNDDGFLVAARKPFNAICLDIGTADAGTVPTRVLEYSVAGGTWTQLSNLLVGNLGALSAAETLFVWMPPTNWAVMEAGHGTGVPTGLYGIRVRATTAPGTTSAVANSLSLAEIISPIEGLADNSIYEIAPAGEEILLENACDSVVALISSKSAIQSWAHVEMRVV